MSQPNRGELLLLINYDQLRSSTEFDDIYTVCHLRAIFLNERIYSVKIYHTLNQNSVANKLQKFTAAR